MVRSIGREEALPIVRRRVAVVAAGNGNRVGLRGLLLGVKLLTEGICDIKLVMVRMTSSTHREVTGSPQR